MGLYWDDESGSWVDWGYDEVVLSPSGSVSDGQVDSREEMSMKAHFNIEEYDLDYASVDVHCTVAEVDGQAGAHIRIDSGGKAKYLEFLNVDEVCALYGFLHSINNGDLP